MRLTAAMIVRDEEAVLDRCLTSIADLVDDIVIVDTGSTDATVDIARSTAPPCTIAPGTTTSPPPATTASIASTPTGSSTSTPTSTSSRATARCSSGPGRPTPTAILLEPLLHSHPA